MWSFIWVIITYSHSHRCPPAISRFPYGLFHVLCRVFLVGVPVVNVVSHINHVAFTIVYVISSDSKFLSLPRSWRGLARYYNHNVYVSAFSSAFICYQNFIIIIMYVHTSFGNDCQLIINATICSGQYQNIRDIWYFHYDILTKYLPLFFKDNLVNIYRQYHWMVLAVGQTIGVWLIYAPRMVSIGYRLLCMNKDQSDSVVIIYLLSTFHDENWPWSYIFFPVRQMAD